MGSFCCCPCGEEFEDYASPSNPIYRHCICLRYFIHQLFSGYTAVFQRLEGRTVASPIQGANPLASTGSGTALSDSSLSDAYHSVPRPAPYESDPRYSRLQRDGLVSRREKSLSHFQEESQPLRRNSSSSGVEHLGVGKKRNGLEFEGESKAGRAESSEKTLSAKASQGVAYILSSEDEDVCPTCLDEYTPENPKIMTRCSHHFHLSCIYEWMERSESCPLCGKDINRIL
ncbi:E3 ubiquitin-protein ligase At3g02290-like isoform X2 [Magnolia sinica]|uniref:E3 ubiquitin-protein ligase At3g02290-like isoform X2 n=1 Tax=Magnolia sinica TaxID=86752 RepID=UPI00265A604F|nr:E3 ubiquitin-protein ligase At3g02290-like isoform X2 [Magnolia sinica]